MMTSTRSQTARSDLAAAAVNLDVDAVTEMVRASIAELGAAWTWEWLIGPVWNGLDRDPAGPDSPLVAERLFSRTVSQVLAATRPRDRAPAKVLACANDEYQTLPLDAYAAALAERGAGSCVLGARVPPQALAAAVDRLRPAVVLIWSQTNHPAGSWQGTSLLTACSGADVITAGPGWDIPALPAHAVPAASVVAAVGLTRALLAAKRSTAGPDSIVAALRERRIA